MNRKVIENASKGILITDKNAVITDVNSSFEKLTGYSREEAIGRKPNITKSGHQPREFYEEMWRQLLDTGTWEGEIWDCKKSGEIFPKWLSINAIKNRDGEIAHYVGMFMDISFQQWSAMTSPFNSI